MYIILHTNSEFEIECAYGPIEEHVDAMNVATKLADKLMHEWESKGIKSIIESIDDGVNVVGSFNGTEYFNEFGVIPLVNMSTLG